MNENGAVPTDFQENDKLAQTLPPSSWTIVFAVLQGLKAISKIFQFQGQVFVNAPWKSAKKQGKSELKCPWNSSLLPFHAATLVAKLKRWRSGGEQTCKQHVPRSHVSLPAALLLDHCGDAFVIPPVKGVRIKYVRSKVFYSVFSKNVKAGDKDRFFLPFFIPIKQSFYPAKNVAVFHSIFIPINPNISSPQRSGRFSPRTKSSLFVPRKD